MWYQIMKKTKFKSVFDNGKYFYSRYVIAYALKSAEEINNDVGIIVSKKVGNSVVRHKFTRRIREVCRLNMDCYLQGYSLILIAKRSILNVDYKELNEDLIKLFKYIRKNEENIN